MTQSKVVLLEDLTSYCGVQNWNYTIHTLRLYG